MVNTKLFDAAVRASGVTLYALAQKCGITRVALYRKRTNRAPFLAREVKIIADALGLGYAEVNEIFFSEGVAKNGNISDR